MDNINLALATKQTFYVLLEETENIYANEVDCILLVAKSDRYCILHLINFHAFCSAFGAVKVFQAKDSHRRLT